MCDSEYREERKHRGHMKGGRENIANGHRSLEEIILNTITDVTYWHKITVLKKIFFQTTENNSWKEEETEENIRFSKR